jgi:hypothetical protein
LLRQFKRLLLQRLWVLVVPVSRYTSGGQVSDRKDIAGDSHDRQCENSCARFWLLVLPVSRHPSSSQMSDRKDIAGDSHNCQCENGCARIFPWTTFGDSFLRLIGRHAHIPITFRELQFFSVHECKTSASD